MGMHALFTVLFAAGCAPSANDATLYLHDAPVTGATVAFDTLMPTQAYVEYGPTLAYGSSTPLSPETTEHEIAILGLHGDTTYHYRIVIEGAGEDIVGEDATFTTMPLPAELPTVEVDGGAASGAGYTLFPVSGGDPMTSTVLIVDEAGEIVWYYTLDGMVLSARPSRDGAAVNFQVSRPGVSGDDSAILRVALDGSEVRELTAHFAHHDFIELPDGTFLSIVTHNQQVGDTFIDGDSIIRTGFSTPTTTIWDAFESLPLVENDGWALSPADWTHANGLDYDEQHELIALSLFRQHQVHILSLDGQTQAILGEGGDFTFVNDPGFGPQHGPRFIEGGLQVFDNAGDGVSRVVQYAIDPDAGTLTPTLEYANPWGEQVMVLGDGLRLGNGAMLSTWGELGDVLTTSAEGQVVRRLHVSGGVGRVQTIADIYPAE